MFRIKTKFSKDYYVHTLPFNGKWITIACVAGAVTSFDEKELFYAGRNHLTQAQRVKEEYHKYDDLFDQGNA